jgi:hypothetical protein
MQNRDGVGLGLKSLGFHLGDDSVHGGRQTLCNDIAGDEAGIEFAEVLDNLVLPLLGYRAETKQLARLKNEPRHDLVRFRAAYFLDLKHHCGQ